MLVLDYAASILDSPSTVLDQQVYRVAACIDPEAVLVILRRDPESAVLVVIDRKMKGLSGPQLRRRISDLAPDLPVILCTGFPEPDDEGMFDAVLVKPVSGRDLAGTVRRVLDGRPGRGPSEGG